MRLADEPGTHGEITVDPPPARVWPLVTDIALSARHSPELQRVEWQDGASAPAVGARFTGYNRNEFMGEWHTTSQIVELEPERVLSWAVIDGVTVHGATSNTLDAPIAVWRFELTPSGAGTRVRHSVHIGRGRSGLTLFVHQHPEHEERIVEGRLDALRAGIEDTLAGLADEARRAGAPA